MCEHKNSEVFDVTSQYWFSTPIREKSTTESVYVRVDELNGPYKFCVIGQKPGGEHENKSYSGGKYIEGYLIDAPGEYALKNYVVEDGYNACYIFCRPWDDKLHHIKFCWSPGVSQQYQYPAIIAK